MVSSLRFLRVHRLTRAASLALRTAVFLPLQLLAQPPASHHHYQLINPGTFGGPGSYVNIEPTEPFINNRGTLVGGADTPILTPVPNCYQPVMNTDCYISDAFVWQNGTLQDLGRLPGGYLSFAGSVNRSGLVVGVSENRRVDPVTGNPQIRAVVWRNGQIQDLGTLGGTASFAADVNDSGQVIGVALNSVSDPYSPLGLGSGYTLTQTRGFLWQGGALQDLGTLGGPDTWAVFINDAGQVAGASFTSDTVDPLTGTPPVGVFVWHNGTMRDIGNLGGDNGLLGLTGLVNGLNQSGQVVGAMMLPGNQSFHAFLWDGHRLSGLGTVGGQWSYARGISDAGAVAGWSTLPGDLTNHAVLWEHGEMTDLGSLGDDPCSDGLAVDSLGQVLGASQSTAGGCNAWTTAFLWENGGPMVDLNTLLTASGSGIYLNAAYAGNELGEIVVAGGPVAECAVGVTCSQIFLLIPCDENHPNVPGCDYSLIEQAKE